MLMGGTGLRLFVVAGGAYGLYQTVPFFAAHAGFLMWVGVFYLVTLALETGLSLAGRPGADAVPSGAASSAE